MIYIICQRVTVLILFTTLISGCSLFSKKDDYYRLADIGSINIRYTPMPERNIRHQDVINYYQKYLEVASDPEMRIRVAHRVASLKLQAGEMEYERVAGKDGLLSEDEDRKLAEASIEDYESLLKDYPDRVDNDSVLYQLAKAYSLTGRINQAISVLETLTRQHPQSIYHQESTFRLAQFYYAAKDYEYARDTYQMLIDYGVDGNRFYQSSRYFLGWTYFKLQDYQKSLGVFSELLEQHYPDEQSLESAASGDLDMLNDSVRIMAYMFDNIGDWESIAELYNDSEPRHYEYKLYSALADFYYSQKYYKSAASTLRAFVKRFPMDKRSPEFYQRLITGYETAGYQSLERKHKELFIDLFGVGTEFWNSRPVDEITKLRAILPAYIWDLAKFSHGWSQKTKVPKEKIKSRDEALRWYQEYIDSFPTADDVVEAHFLYAELAFEKGDYVAAKDQYEIVAYQFPLYERASDSGYAALLSYMEVVPKEAHEAKLWREQQIASAQRFVNEYPEDTRRGTVLVNSAELLLQDAYYKQALETARLAQQGATLPERYQYGASLVQGHASFELGLFAESEAALLKASKYSNLDTQTRQSLINKSAASIYQQGETLKESEPLIAVEHWLRLVNLYPNNTLSVSAEYDAATLLMNSGDYENAENVLLSFQSKYPDHKLTQNIPSKLIVTYESIGKWRDAALVLQDIWKNSKDIEEQRVACFQSAEYFEKANDIDNAIVMYKRYAHSYKRPFNSAVEAHHKLDTIYEEMGNTEKRHFWLDKIITLHKKAGKSATERSQFLAAKAAFELAEYERSKFDNIDLTLPLAKSILLKNTPMQIAIKRYTQAVEFGVLDYTTISTYQLGYLYETMANELLNSEKPAGLDELELEEYGFLLEDQAFPLQEAAITIHQSNGIRSAEGLYDRWIEDSFAALSRLMPGQYDKPFKQVPYVEAMY